MYTFNVEVDLPVDAAVEKLKASLAEEKMGVVSEINVTALMKAKLDHDMPEYRIIGACAPGLARRVIEADQNAGSLLPCGVAVFDIGGGRTRFAFQDPQVIGQVMANPVIQEVAQEARTLLKRVCERLTA
jgi:uncharacterized protein (DUF302 family)